MNVHKRIGILLRVNTDMQVMGDSPEHHEGLARSYATLKEWEVRYTDLMLSAGSSSWDTLKQSVCLQTYEARTSQD